MKKDRPASRFTSLAPSVLVGVALLSTAPRSGWAEASPPVFRIATDDGQSSLRLQIAAQIRWSYEYADAGTGESAASSNDIQFRRLRLILGGSLVTERLTYRLHLNLVPGAVELVDFWSDYQLHEQLSMRLGQFKVPFTRYRLGSWSNRPVLEWSHPTRYFGAERQIGLMLHNNVGRPPRFEYQVGLYTGVNARASNGVAIPRVFGTDRPNLSALVDPAAPSSFHPEVGLHLAYNHGDISVRGPQDFEGGGPRFSVGLSGVWDARPTAGQDMALRLAPEVIFKLHGFCLWGVFYMAFWDHVTDDEGIDLGFLGGVAQASYVFLDRYEVGLRYTNVSILDALRRDARAQADQRIAAVDDDEAQAALARRLSSVGLLEAEHELTLGFSVFALERTLKFGVDGGLMIHQRTDGNRYDMLIRVQAQLGF